MSVKIEFSKGTLAYFNSLKCCNNRFFIINFDLQKGQAYFMQISSGLLSCQYIFESPLWLIDPFPISVERLFFLLYHEEYSMEIFEFNIS